MPSRFFLVLSIIFLLSCQDKNKNSLTETEVVESVITGAEQIDRIVEIIGNQSLGLVVNHTSLVDSTHLVDTLASLEIDIEKVFTPEHGFRGTADAGEKVDDYRDPDTGIPVISLYGSKKKPLPEDLENIQILIFDLQDVGTRFFTYISTMHYIMQAAAESDIKVLILDRPNPNGHYVDGPVREEGFESFVGMHPIPVVHGCTVAELAKMINGESWLGDSLVCDLTIIPVLNYTHDTRYELPVKPSPNLPTMNAIYHYPSLCFFEGTVMSVGRGTYNPFEKVGYPDSTFGSYFFTPVSIDGMSKYPKYQDEACYGINLENHLHGDSINLQFLIDFYTKFHDPEAYFNSYFDVLAGTDQLRQQIIAGKSPTEIRQSWQQDLDNYLKTREKYLIYD